MNRRLAALRGTVAERASFMAAFALGSAIGLFMVFNSQLSGDQVQMLNLGWQLAHNHHWLPYGMRTSAGGFSPGGLTGLLVGAQLRVWEDYRAPALFLLLMNAGAVLLLAQAARPALTAQGRLMLLVLVWLSPWHLYFSAHIWDPNYMFVFAVLHLFTAQHMAQRSDPWSTAGHVLVLALGIQIHTSAAILWILSALLILTRRVTVNPIGLSVGLLLGTLSFLPWLFAVHTRPELLPVGLGFPLRGLLFVFPLLRGVLYWFKVSSLSVAPRMNDFDFTPNLGVMSDHYLRPAAATLALLAHVTLLVCVWLHWRALRKAPRLLWAHVGEPYRPRAWLCDYVMTVMVAALISFAVCPTTIMFWQVLIALPASALVSVMTSETLLRTRFRILVTRGAVVWCVASVALALCQALGAPMYRCGGYPIGIGGEMLVELKARPDCYALLADMH